MKGVLKSTNEPVFVLGDMKNTVDAGYLAVVFPFPHGVARSGMRADVRRVRRDNVRLIKDTIGLEGVPDAQSASQS